MKNLINKIRKSLKNESGFSLLELLLAVLLVAIIASGFATVIQGGTVAGARLMDMQSSREKNAGNRDDYFTKNAEQIQAEYDNRVADTDNTPYDKVKVKISGISETFQCYKFSEDGSNLSVFVQKP